MSRMLPLLAYAVRAIGMFVVFSVPKGQLSDLIEQARQR